MKHILIYFVRKYNNDWDKIYKALFTKEKVLLEDIKQMEAWVLCDPFNKVITIIEEEYPEELKQIDKPPFAVMIDQEGNIITELPSL